MNTSRVLVSHGCACERGSTCDVAHDPATCRCNQCTSAEGLAMPDGLTIAGRTAHKIIVRLLRARKLTHTGGCKVFYSPKAWKARGEEYGTDGVLIVVYDGADAREAFDPHPREYRGATYPEFRAMRDALAKEGLRAEMCTHWYSAVYEERST